MLEDGKSSCIAKQQIIYVCEPGRLDSITRSHETISFEVTKSHANISQKDVLSGQQLPPPRPFGSAHCLP